MNRTKFRILSIFTLILAFTLVMSFAVGTLFTVKSAKAAEYRSTDIFSEGVGGTVGTSQAGEGETPYIEFTFSGDDSKVHFRRDLALKWYAPLSASGDTEDEEGEEGEEAAEAETAPAFETKYFSMTFAFPTLDFTRFTLRFEAAEENISKEGTSVNSLVFFHEEGKLSVAVRDAASQPAKDLEGEDVWFTDRAEKKELAVGAGEDISVSFAETQSFGGFAVKVNGEEVGVFTNIGGYFMEYLSSASTTPRDPITFTADKLAADKTEQKLLMKELNGQSFKLNANNRIEDNADPALIVNEAVYAYTLGRKWSLTYEAVDVCDSSVSVTRKYAMVNAANEDGSYPKPVDSEYSALTTSTVFIPTSDTQEEEQYVSIYFDLDDGTNLSGLDSAAKAEKRVYLWWYAAEGQTKTLASAQVYECPVCGNRLNQKAYDELEEGWTCPNPDDKADHGEIKKTDLVAKNVDDFTYIIVNRGDVDQTSGEKSGPYYVGVTADRETLTNKDSEESKALAAAYQQAIDEIVFKKDDEGNLTQEYALSAGEGSYFYLPSLRELIKSANADYRNLRFSIYYKKQGLETSGSASSATSLRYNALRFEIDEAGKYIFKVLATDAAGNAMKYYVDGKLVAVSSSNIWDIDEIPTFNLYTGYTGATVEDPGTQSLGYRESTYSLSSFDIVALDGYTTKYKLFRFDESGLKEGQKIPSYSDFVENAKTYFEEYQDCLKEIRTYNSDVSEDDTDRWERTDNKYHWDPDSSLSFVPQEATLYVVQLEVSEESNLPGHTATAYQVIEVQNPIDPRPNETYWLENNITSVVLFSISGVLLVIIVILFVVKPSDKKIEDVDVSTLRGKKKDKKD